MAKKSAKKNNLRIAPEKLKLVIVAVVAVLVGAVGTYMVTKSSAAVISGSATNCGSAYGQVDPNTGFGPVYIENIVYQNGLKNSDSVRNIAKYTCEKGHLIASSALRIQKSGAWSSTLSKAVMSFEKSDTRLAAAADGVPDAKMVCALAEKKTTYPEGTYYSYGAPMPSGFPNNDCFSLLGTSWYPYGK